MKLSYKSIRKNSWLLHIIIPNNIYVNEIILSDIYKTYFELNENKITIYQNLWGTDKAMLRGKCMALNMYKRHEERSYVNMLSFTLEN